MDGIKRRQDLHRLMHVAMVMTFEPTNLQTQAPFIVTETFGLLYTS